MRILVIDDDVDSADGIRDLLQSEGHEVDTAHDGARGLERARAFLPQIILCDLGLPKVSGFEVARNLRADPELGRVTLVALTGHATRDDVANAKSAGFDAHFTKPLLVDELLVALEEVAKLRREV